jgi:ABC-2 type transport system ATP-binding protein
VFGYLGPNGAGKTTTIRLLLDFLRPTAGRTSVLGGTGADPEVRRRIGYLPADLHIDAAYSTDDVVAYYGELRGGVDRARVDELVARFDVDPRRPFGELSTGNRRKVGIVQAFMHRPELVILDEPTSGLDPLLQQEFHHLVAEVAADGTTVFLSSHLLHEVEVLAERVAILKKGRLVTVATVDDLRTQARQRITLHVDGAADPHHFDGVEGVVEATAMRGVVHLVVEGRVDAALKAAAALTVVRIEATAGDLEDVFLRFYAE